jgi:hypothetical protein
MVAGLVHANVKEAELPHVKRSNGYHGWVKQQG